VAVPVVRLILGTEISASFLLHHVMQALYVYRLFCLSVYTFCLSHSCDLSIVARYIVSLDTCIKWLQQYPAVDKTFIKLAQQHYPAKTVKIKQKTHNCNKNNYIIFFFLKLFFYKYIIQDQIKLPIHVIQDPSLYYRALSTLLISVFERQRWSGVSRFSIFTIL